MQGTYPCMGEWQVSFLEFQMIDELKAETRMIKWIDLKSTFIILGFTVFGFLFRNNVYGPLEIPFIVFNFLVGITFSFKSPWNREKMLWQSLLLYIKNMVSRKSKYHAVEHECYEEDIISCSKLMYSQKYSIGEDV